MVKDFVLLSGSSCLKFTELLAKEMGRPLGRIKKTIFPDGEIGIELEENVLRKEVFILQSCVGEPNHYLMELMLIADALKRAGAEEITAVLPYYPYCRQDRLTKPEQPISARVVSEMLEAVGVTRVISFDLHQGQLEGFFDVPFLHLSAIPVLCEKIRELRLDNPIIVAPDAGGAKIARKYASCLGCEFVVVDKFRGPNGIDMRLIGQVEGADVVIVDDICSTAGTLVQASALCEKRGAKKIFSAVTHALLVGDAIDRLKESKIQRLYASDTIPNTFSSDKIEVVSISRILAEGIKSVSSNYDQDALLL